MAKRTDSDSFSDRTNDSKGYSQAPSLASTDYLFAHMAQPDNQAMLKSQLTMIKKWNTTIVRDSPITKGKAITNTMVGLLTFFCEHLKTSALVKYLAIEIYDKWMVFYATITERNTYCCTSVAWLNEKESVRKNTLLYLLVCVQLASKLVGRMDNCYLVTGEIQKFLRKYQNRCVSCVEVMDAEVTILRSLEYNICVLTPIEVSEILLMLLHLTKCRYRQLYHFCVKLTDFVYLSQDEVYTNFCQLSNNPLDLNGEQYCKIKNNYVLRAAATVVSAVALHNNTERTEKICRRMSKLTEESDASVSLLAASILTCLRQVPCDSGVTNSLTQDP